MELRSKKRKMSADEPERRLNIFVEGFSLGPGILRALPANPIQWAENVIQQEEKIPIEEQRWEVTQIGVWKKRNEKLLKEKAEERRRLKVTRARGGGGRSGAASGGSGKDGEKNDNEDDEDNPQEKRFDGGCLDNDLVEMLERDIVQKDPNTHW